VIPFLRRTVQATFGLFNTRISYLRPGAVTGLDLWRDMAVVVGTPAPVCLDVGANRGQTIEALQKHFDAPSIHAFEPSRQMCDILHQRRFGDRTHIYNAALSATAGSRNFIEYSQSDLSSFFPFEDCPENRFRHVPIERTGTVPVWTVDQFMADAKLEHVHLLKIDTQGNDLEVLRGAEESLQRQAIDHVLVELIYVRTYVGQAHPLQIMHFLEDHQMALVAFYECVFNDSVLGWCTALFRRAGVRGG
jgi:FkbM family methyltransferase